LRNNEDNTVESYVDTHVAFAATSDDFIEYQDNEIVQFNIVLSNVGGNYNSSSGEFHCPISGFYQFKTTICSSELILNIQIDGAKIATVFSPFPCSSQSIIYNCEVGQQVAILTTGLGPHMIFGDRRSTFSGHFLFSSQ
jgi:hypothetical protein